jgi:hypothetical protein
VARSTEEGEKFRAADEFEGSSEPWPWTWSWSWALTWRGDATLADLHVAVHVIVHDDA